MRGTAISTIHHVVNQTVPRLYASMKRKTCSGSYRSRIIPSYPSRNKTGVPPNNSGSKVSQSWPPMLQISKALSRSLISASHLPKNAMMLFRRFNRFFSEPLTSEDLAAPFSPELSFWCLATCGLGVLGRSMNAGV